MSKVAIIKYLTVGSCDDSYSLDEHMIQHITDWTEVDQSIVPDLRAGIMLLNQKQGYHKAKYHLVEHHPITADFVSATVEGYRQHLAELNAAEERRKAAAAEQKRIRDEKKALKALKLKEVTVQALKDKIEELEGRRTK